MFNVVQMRVKFARFVYIHGIPAKLDVALSEEHSYTM